MLRNIGREGGDAKLVLAILGGLVLLISADGFGRSAKAAVRGHIRKQSGLHLDGRCADSKLAR